MESGRGAVAAVAGPPWALALRLRSVAMVTLVSIIVRESSAKSPLLPAPLPLEEEEEEAGRPASRASMSSCGRVVWVGGEWVE